MCKNTHLGVNIREQCKIVSKFLVSILVSSLSSSSRYVDTMMGVFWVDPGMAGWYPQNAGGWSSHLNKEAEACVFPQCIIVLGSNILVLQNGDGRKKQWEEVSLNSHFPCWNTSKGALLKRNA